MGGGPSTGFRRFLHFGPIIAISIIKSITFTTLYMNSMWWPPQQSLGGFINQTIFLMLSALTVFNFVMASLIGPGQLPLKWRPKNKEDEKFLQYCDFCEGFKAPRSHHCQRCERCIIKMDHHCPWINTCTGWANQCYFIAFLAFAVIGSFHACFILVCALLKGLTQDAYTTYIHAGLMVQQPTRGAVHIGIYSLVLSVFNIGLAVGVIIAVGMLLFFQLRAVLRNRTGIEDWILEKAKYRSQATGKPFVYPYDLGRWENWKQVLNWNCAPVGDGIEWPVVDGCDQYTLTCEQLEQKKVKRKRAGYYEITKEATGSWCPIWSQGIKTVIFSPISDESRIKLDVGDKVRVTRWRKHWLFGEKLQPETNGGTEHKKLRIRGWFPRQCAMELYDGDEDYDESPQTTTNDTDLNSNGNAKKLK
ncbi:palmitoyltransferase ZDHHC6 [Culicoides brevitarsis]|uniref:palmitoyltransferase ZDHHC6 n=1 Tax=Culicoides brevitarsis TaxID=469753 RepID=UPI00307B6B56